MMKELKELLNYFKEHKGVTVITVVAAIFGGRLGVIAYYNGLLG